MSRREFVAASLAATAGCALATRARGEDASDQGPREASYYETLPGNSVRCLLCPMACVVPDGKRGLCRVRENRGGKYFSLVYNRPCTVAPDDPIEKKPFFHVYPGSKTTSIATVGCNFRCKFCQNWDISQLRTPDDPWPIVPPAAVVQQALKNRSRTVAYTYSEPVIFYEYMVDCAKAVKDAGLGNVVVSNGFINEKPLKAMIPLMTAVKIDFKAFTEKFYRETCSGQLEPVKKSLTVLARSGVWFEIVVLIVPTLNDNMDDIKRMSAWIAGTLGQNVAIHFTRFHPQYQIRNLPPTPADTLQQARSTAMKEGCNYVYTGNTPGEESENTYCHNCKNLLVRRAGLGITLNGITGGKCNKCEAVIPGVWDQKP